MDFILRPFHINDIVSLVKHANNIKIAKFLTNAFPNPYTTEHAKAFVAMATQDDPVHIFAIEINGEAAGAIGIHPQKDIMCKNAELGYWLAEPYWGNGIITEAIKQVVPLGFSLFDITRIYARPYGNNPASQKVLEKAGFQLEAKIEKNIYKNGEFLDELIYAVRKQ